MLIRVFRQAQRSGKLPEAWFRDSAKPSLGSWSEKPLKYVIFNDISKIAFLTCRLNEALQRPKTKLPVTYEIFALVWTPILAWF